MPTIITTIYNYKICNQVKLYIVILVIDRGFHMLGI